MLSNVFDYVKINKKPFVTDEVSLFTMQRLGIVFVILLEYNKLLFHNKKFILGSMYILMYTVLPDIKYASIRKIIFIRAFDLET